MGKTSGNRLSVRPSDATEGGGIEGALATVAELEYVQEFRYNNGAQGGAAVRVKFQIDGMDKPWEQHYSLGKSDRFEVVEDGDAVEFLGKGQAGLNKKSNAFKFFNSLADAIDTAKLDFDELVPDGNLATLREFFEAGNQVRLTNVKKQDVDGNEKDIPVIGEIVVSAKGSKSTTKKNGKAAANDDDGDELQLKTIGIIEQILSRADGLVKFADLPQAIYDLCKKDPEVRAMRQWASSEKNVADGPWTYNQKKRVLEAS